MGILYPFPPMLLVSWSVPSGPFFIMIIAIGREHFFPRTITIGVPITIDFFAVAITTCIGVVLAFI